MLALCRSHSGKSIRFEVKEVQIVLPHPCWILQHTERELPPSSPHSAVPSQNRRPCITRRFLVFDFSIFDFRKSLFKGGDRTQKNKAAEERRRHL